jgi:3-isopropylmalate/(R)-2-methylmalate dehydratase small subunit
VIASSFGDIFYNNCFKNGVLPIVLSKDQIQDLFLQYENSGSDMAINLETKLINTGDNQISFDVDENLLERIIYGLDDVDISLKHKDLIKRFEEERMKEKPWIFAHD